MDVLSLLNEYVFLGQEFLTWLWYESETEQQLTLDSGKQVLLMLGDRLVLGPVQGSEGVRVTVKGQEVSLAEAREALRRGKQVEAMRLGLEIDGEEFWMNLRGADLAVSSMRMPPTAPGEDGEEGLILERIALAETALATIEELFGRYLARRLDDHQAQELLRDLRQWVAGQE